MGTQNRVQPPGLGLERRDGDICWVTAESAWPCPVLDLSGQNCFRSYSFIWGEGAPRGSSLHPVPVPTSHLAPFIISSSPCGGVPKTSTNTLRFLGLGYCFPRSLGSPKEEG